MALALLGAGCSTDPAKGGRGHRANVPTDIANIPDAVPKVEPLARYGNPDNYMVFGQRYNVMRDSRGYVERGVASWYGPGFHEKLTSTRENYDMYAMTAAHKTLPLPTYAQVTNLRNGRSIIVRINDRGPFVDNRIIDLSYVAGVKLGIDGPGTGFVEVRAIDPIEWARNRDRRNDSIDTGTVATVTPLRAPQEPKIASGQPAAGEFQPAPPNNGGEEGARIYIQVGAFSSPDNAFKLRDSLQVPNVAARVQPNGALYKVQIGPLASVEQADELFKQLGQYGVQQAHYVTEDGSLLRR
ncbi:septal ring lytic transglycosylase RlpA family protein [Methylogaea oryzae]|uniref:Endolytic peptidoglycan transglycosylase RlpA n=1 Tax=Methylogaea oryzae TaxID=1295382 RepID=A0A8D4VNM9_9GAMM|nr:septal ring lytic transglycosylase RlpA family protein [Methylogaea oryzae]BBL69859.1 lipoprotein [Methylogaea oryzae]